MTSVSSYEKTDSPGFLSDKKPTLLIENVPCIIAADQDYSLSFYSADSIWLRAWSVYKLRAVDRSADLASLVSAKVRFKGFCQEAGLSTSFFLVNSAQINKFISSNEQLQRIHKRSIFQGLAGAGLLIADINPPI